MAELFALKGRLICTLSMRGLLWTTIILHQWDLSVIVNKWSPGGTVCQTVKMEAITHANILNVIFKASMK
jgi:hypothetical protein